MQPHDACYLGLAAQVGVGAVSTDPRGAAGWRFFDADFNGLRGNNDEYFADLALAQTQSDAVVFRFSGDGKQTWTYCDQDFDTSGFDAGQLSRYQTSNNPDFAGCRLLTAAASVSASTSAAVVGLVQTDTGNSQYPVAAAQALVGPA